MTPNPTDAGTSAPPQQPAWEGWQLEQSVPHAYESYLVPALLSGERSGLKARLTSAPLKLAFDGTVANRTSLMMEGTVTIDSLSLRNAMRWTGQPPPPGGFGRFALKARANVVGGSVALTNVKFQFYPFTGKELY